MFNKFCRVWKDTEPKAVRCFKRNFYDTLVYYDYKDNKNFISTTNNLERVLEEVRRRIEIQGHFKKERSLELWLYGIIKQLQPEQQQPDGIHYYITIIKEPKYKNVQFT